MGSEPATGHDWNVLVTVYEEEFREAMRLLHEFGETRSTGYHNVISLKVDDPLAFTRRLGDRIKAEPGLLNSLSHVVPAQITFDFNDVADFEQKAHAALLQFVPQLKGRRFHVRMHRRGMKQHMSSQTEEQHLDGFLLEALAEAAAPGAITFDDPDAIVAVETIRHRAGFSLWTREDLKRYPFLRLD